MPVPPLSVSSPDRFFRLPFGGAGPSMTTAAVVVNTGGLFVAVACGSIACVSAAGSGHWNHNTHYHRLVLDAAGVGAASALDVGSGDGLLAAELRDLLPQVTGIDVDADVVGRARGLGVDVDWIVGDVMTYPLPECGFDLVASIAVVHHLPDLGAALARLADLTTPGGSLVVIGLARSASLADFAWDAVGAVQHRALSRRRGYFEHTAPVMVAPVNGA